MKNILTCWIGFTDLKASNHDKKVGLGPIGQAVTSKKYDEVCLLSDLQPKDTDCYVNWLKEKTDTPIIIYLERLTSPTAFSEIYEAAARTVASILKNHGEDAELTFHISPGTPQMAAVWIILSKTRFPAEIIESSIKYGVQTSSVPFDISAEFIPDLLRKPDERLKSLSASLPPDAPEFSAIIHKSRVMKRIIAKARHVAPRSVSVLIEGDSGTGKELLARAIHMASPRNKNSFVAVNCGAIPNELVESELFGYVKGAFTGADKLKKGYFEEADKGTLFLDEVGELSPATQVKLLRALQENEIVRVGSTKTVNIDVRIIAATNRNLIKEIQNGNFRSDLFYRISVAILRLPSLKDRAGDIGLLIDCLLKQINKESENEPGYKYKKISASAKNLMINHDWPGNVRELMNTLRRAAIWSEGTTITIEEIRESLILEPQTGPSDILNKPLGEGLDLQAIIAEVAQHYLYRALDEANGNKTKASNLVGLSSYQTFTNWMKKYGIK